MANAYWSVAIVYEFDGPSTLVTDPHEDDTRCVASGQLLVRFIPPDKANLEKKNIFNTPVKNVNQ